MKKIGIITLNGYFNYGNRLQNYALQEVLKSFNYDVETIWVENKVRTKKSKSTREKLKMIVKDPKAILRRIYRLFYLDNLNNQREQIFKDFSNKYIKETTTKISEDYLPNDFLNQYEYFVTGSDQVWNPFFTNASPLYFLTFAPKEKRIAYSPSFGISELPAECVNDFSTWIDNMAYLSVREDAGADIIYDLTGRNAKVLADPTLLLSKENWLSIAKPVSNKPKEDYLLTYFLGAVPDTTKAQIKKYAQKYNLRVVNLAKSKYKEFYLTDPAEFLDFINSATLFYTDSFHGTVFSILFETPFIVTDRKGQLPSMNSRIKTLLSKFVMEERHINNIEEEKIFNVDFSQVGSILEEERNKSFTYLGRALNKEKTI